VLHRAHQPPTELPQIETFDLADERRYLAVKVAPFPYFHNGGRTSTTAAITPNSELWQRRRHTGKYGLRWFLTDSCDARDTSIDEKLITAEAIDRSIIERIRVSWSLWLGLRVFRLSATPTFKNKRASNVPGYSVR
jgi:hypothetical protein